jgi:Family of unknown function (DUF6526)
MSAKTQDYKTHRQFVPLYHIGVNLLSLAIIVGGVVYAFQDCSHNCLLGSLIAGIGFTLIIVGFVARGFGIRAQDRAIRAEENFRAYLLTGKPQDSRLRLGQIIALRFASDEEYVALAAKAIAENLKQDEIKKLIKNWRGDFHRV